ncbi:hypothetical protein C6503_19855 [Candidatus Poribacteria bacterium]|nr:MAG: hypothetical protein C6503_19855 [Candidatus Poribacteria bacterium]
MKSVLFLMFLLLLIVALQAESQTGPVTIDLNGSVTGSSNISSNGGHTTYTRYQECWITDLDPDGDGHFHVYDWEPTIYPTKITVSIDTPAKGYGYVKGQLDSAIINGSQQIKGSGGKVTTGSAGTWWIDYDAMKPKAQEAFYTHYVRKSADAPTGLDTTYSWSSSGRGDCYSIYWRGSASVSVTLTTGVTTSHNGIGVLSTAALVKSGQVTWGQSTLVQNGEGGTGGGTWKVVHKERCRVCKDEVGMHEHQRLCNGCLEWYECYKHPGNHIEVSCPQNDSGQYCEYSSYYKCSPHTHAYSGSGSGSGGGLPATGDTGGNPPTPSPSMHPCNIHNTSESGDHSYQASCSSTDSNGNYCTVTNFYACQSHTHSYPSPPASPPPSGNTVPCAAGHPYNPNSNWAVSHHRTRTCRFSTCGKSWQLCQGPKPDCSAAIRQGEKCWAR